MKLTAEQEDSVTVENMQKVIRDILESPYELYHDTDRAHAYVFKMMDVLEYFMRPSEMKAFCVELYSKHPEPFNSLIDSLIPFENRIKETENEDGSLDIDIDCTEDEQKCLATLGIKFCVIKACIDLNASDNDLITWARIGRKYTINKEYGNV